MSRAANRRRERDARSSVTLSSPLTRVFGALLLIPLILFVTWEILVVPDGVNGAFDRWIGGFVASSLIWFGTSASLLPRVVISVDHVTVVNILRRWTIPLSSISSCFVDDDGGLIIRLLDKREIGVFAFSGSLGGMLAGSSRNARTARVIEKAVLDAEPPRDPGHVRSSVVAFLVGYAIALAAWTALWFVFEVM